MIEQFPQSEETQAQIPPALAGPTSGTPPHGPPEVRELFPHLDPAQQLSLYSIAARLHVAKSREPSEVYERADDGKRYKLYSGLVEIAKEHPKYLPTQNDLIEYFNKKNKARYLEPWQVVEGAAKHYQKGLPGQSARAWADEIIPPLPRRKRHRRHEAALLAQEMKTVQREVDEQNGPTAPQTATPIHRTKKRVDSDLVASFGPDGIFATRKGQLILNRKGERIVNSTESQPLKASFLKKLDNEELRKGIINTTNFPGILAKKGASGNRKTLKHVLIIANDKLQLDYEEIQLEPPTRLVLNALLLLRGITIWRKDAKNLLKLKEWEVAQAYMQLAVSLGRAQILHNGKDDTMTDTPGALFMRSSATFFDTRSARQLRAAPKKVFQDLEVPELPRQRTVKRTDSKISEPYSSI